MSSLELRGLPSAAYSLEVDRDSPSLTVQKPAVCSVQPGSGPGQAQPHGTAAATFSNTQLPLLGFCLKNKFCGRKFIFSTKYSMLLMVPHRESRLDYYIRLIPFLSIWRKYLFHAFPPDVDRYIPVSIGVHFNS